VQGDRHGDPARGARPHGVRLSAFALSLAVLAPGATFQFTSRWSLRWWAIAGALLIPVIVLRIAEWRLRARA